MDILDQVLGGEAPSEQDTAPAAQPEAEQPSAQPRGPDGKFAAATPDAAPVEQPAPAPPTEAPKAAEPGHVPMAALLDERDKRKALEDRLKALEQQQRPADNAPDIDPDTANLVLKTKLDISEEMARDKYGDETVDKAREWIMGRFAQNPAFQQEVLAKANPYKFTVEEFQRHERLSAVSDDTEWTQFQAWKAAQASGQANPAPAQPAAAAPVAAAPPAPPRSLAQAPNAGGNVNTAPVGPGVAFDAVFKT